MDLDFMDKCDGAILYETVGGKDRRCRSKGRDSLANTALSDSSDETTMLTLRQVTNRYPACSALP